MNPIILPNKFVYYDDDWYLSHINNDKKNYFFKIDNRNIINVINKIKSNNNYINSNFIIHNFLYFLYKLIQSNDIKPNLEYSEGGVPNLGMEFINKNTSEYIGIYHIHLSKIDSSVIVWYPKLTKRGFILHFEYLIHPTDDYEKTLTDIYNDVDGYHIDYMDYFINLKKLLNFNIQEKKIFNFIQYIKTLEKFIR